MSIEIEGDSMICKECGSLNLKTDLSEFFDDGSGTGLEVVCLDCGEAYISSS